MPPIPEPLRYQVHQWNDESYVVATALLFRQERLQIDRVPFLRVSYPQFSLRLCTLDADSVPSVLFLSVLVPGWVLPTARLVAKQPAFSARLRYPNPSRTPDADGWRWQVRHRGTLSVAARQGSPLLAQSPSIGSWHEMTNYVHQRPRGYVLGPSGLRQVELSRQPSAFWPVDVELEEKGLLSACLPKVEADEWSRMQSAWLCPEIPFVFEIGPAVELAKLRRSTAPVAADPAMFSKRVSRAVIEPDTVTKLHSSCKDETQETRKMRVLACVA